MCFFEKGDFFLWINLDGYDQKLTLRLPLTEDRRNYSDHFTVERSLGVGKGTEVLFTLPLGEISDVTYATGDPYCILSFDTADERFKAIRVDRHCFNLLSVKRMIKVVKKHNEKNGMKGQKALSDGGEKARNDK